MSKSADSDMSRINLLDDPKTVQSKVMKAKTDSLVGLEFDNDQRPEAHNLLSIYHVVTNMSKVRASPCTVFRKIRDLGSVLHGCACIQLQ